jgi:hypothetical protein
VVPESTRSDQLSLCHSQRRGTAVAVTWKPHAYSTLAVS